MFDIFRQPIIVIPKTGYWDINGVWIESDGVPFQALASVQPLNGRDMEMLPEGRYTTQTFRLYSDIRLHGVDDQAEKNGDIVILGAHFDPENSDRFEVITVFPWQNNIISHYKMIIAKTDPDQGL